MPRQDRYDEWYVTTPLIVAQSHHGFPRFTNDGIGRHDLSLVLDIPNHDWSTAFKPWDVPVLFLDIEQGFAARWWLMAAILILGVYTLLLELTDRVDIAVLFSLMAFASPFIQWWYEAITLETIGMGSFAVALLLHSIGAQKLWVRLTCIGAATYAAIGFLFLFYPPFQVPVALVLGAAGVGEVLKRHRMGLVRASEIIVSIACVGSLVAIAGVGFYIHAKSGFDAINNSVYPGKRRSTGGNTSILQLLSAPFGYAIAANGGALTTTNQSEISSFLLIGPFVALQIFRLRLRAFAAIWRPGVIAVGLGMWVVLLWYLVSLPPDVAAITLLNRSEPSRSIIGVGLGGLLLAALYCGAELIPQEGRALIRLRIGRAAFTIGEARMRIAFGAVGCGLAACLVYFWAGRQFILALPVLHMSLGQVGIMSVAAGCVVGLICDRRVIAGGIAGVLLGGLVSLGANPLYQGLGSLQRSPLNSSVIQVSHRVSSGGKVWLSFSPSTSVDAVLLASGVPTMNAVDLYPDAGAWKVLDPREDEKGAWDRYANVVFSLGAPGSTRTIRLIQTTAVRVTVDPCTRVLTRFHVGYVVTTSKVTYGCLHEVGKSGIAGVPVFIYERN